MSGEASVDLPDTITTIDELEDRLSEPTPGAIEALAQLDGDLMLLGAGGKMGPSLARMARRAFDAAGVRRRVHAVSRFGEGQTEAFLRTHGVEPIRCDLLDPDQLQRLPDVHNVIFMTGRKFGSTGQEALTWAMNVSLPGMVCQKFRHSRLVAFSTGNVYGLTPVALGGSVENDMPRPIGEYAMSALGRERIFEYFSRQYGIPLVLLRLNYATELRYGVLVDVARPRPGGGADRSGDGTPQCPLAGRRQRSRVTGVHGDVQSAARAQSRWPGAAQRAPTGREVWPAAGQGHRLPRQRVGRSVPEQRPGSTSALRLSPRRARPG